jgi:CheY-like chemotaxis protein
MEFLDVEGGPLADQLDAYLTMNVGSEQRPRPRIAADILLVDPDPGHVAILCDSLRRAGNRVSTAAGGIEALGMVLRVPPDIIVAEIDLPTMDGWRLLRLVRERPSIAHIPIILYTARCDDAIRLRGYQAGADDVLAKPVGGQELLGRIERALGRAQEPRRQTSRNALRGDLGQVPLASVLSFIEVERRTGQMLVVHGETIATVFIRDGAVVHVDMPSARGEDALERLFHLLDWREGQFELTAMDVSVPRSIEMPIGHALLEHARRSDENAR